jgi:hypothetical protein
MDLETRHDDLLSRLDELDKRVAKTLAECMTSRKPIVVTEMSASSSGQ